MQNRTHCKAVISFYLKGTFRSYDAALEWANNNGYSAGSSDCGGIVALQKGRYNLPQKWKNLSTEEKANVDGIMHSEDFREGFVTINLFK